MSLAWGGHQNGRIPISALSPIGRGQLPGGMQYGKQQYLHYTAARAWQALVKAVAAETGVRLRVTEGYRDYALQKYYWDLLFDPRLSFQKAAWPGNSSHGWARAVDMYGYTVSALQAVRRIGPAFGWSLATGDRVNEPWHIEYVGSLTNPPDFGLAEGEVTNPIPAPKPPTPRRNSMAIKFRTISPEGVVKMAVAGLAPGTASNWFELNSEAAQAAINSQIPGTAIEVGWPNWGTRAAEFRAAPQAASVDLDLAPVLAALETLPQRTQEAIFK